MKTEKDRITELFDRISRESIDINSEKFPEIVKEHGFEHIRTEENGAFILKDIESQKYFRARNKNDFEEIESP
jgi:hypothetical protein